MSPIIITKAVFTIPHKALSRPSRNGVFSAPGKASVTLGPCPHALLWASQCLGPALRYADKGYATSISC